MIPRQPRSTLFPYTTLFRSVRHVVAVIPAAPCRDLPAGDSNVVSILRLGAGRGGLHPVKHAANIRPERIQLLRVFLETHSSGLAIHLVALWGVWRLRGAVEGSGNRVVITTGRDAAIGLPQQSPQRDVFARGDAFLHRFPLRGSGLLEHGDYFR